MPREEFRVDEALVDESVRGSARAPGVAAAGRAAVKVGRVQAQGHVDLERGEAAASASATTVEVNASGSIDTPVVDGQGSATARGPSAHGSASASRDGIEAGAGVSAGEVGVDAGVEILGDEYRYGVKFGLKAEVGVKWGPTSRIKLPLVTLEGPNPAAALTQFGAEALKNLVTDPIGTVEDTAEDVADAAVDAAETAVDVVLVPVKLMEDLFDTDDDGPPVATHDGQYEHKERAPKGTVYFD
ncbi:hypothetical protein [Agrococcus sp. TF02-05]|uniref:hypothetical protein n=1 Tax=Agrococcus sp. TF02-05 TaxID=2815211 RepID=UPI001AA0D078|nr:hypothetical protein [Agrococcus sp. TF02-05]MBO1771099.1 hypothetical protein [Agrococcus sp. TF02-05]